MTSFLRVAALPLLVIASLAGSGCDSGGDESSALSAPSSDERETLADYLSNEYDCDVEVETLTGTESGTLGDSDCLRADGSDQDFYAFVVEDDADVRVEMESDDFPPYLFLVSADPDAGPPQTVAIGENESEGDQASVAEDLDPGLYFVIANSYSGNQSGDYTITVEADAAGTDR